MMLTRALDKSFPLSVVPAKASRKLTFGSGMWSTFFPRTTKPVMLMLQQKRIPLSVDSEYPGGGCELSLIQCTYKTRVMSLMTPKPLTAQRENLL